MEQAGLSSEPEQLAEESGQLESQAAREAHGELASSLDDPEDLMVAWVNETPIRRSEVDALIERRVCGHERGGRRTTIQWRNTQRRQIVRRLVEEEALRQHLNEASIEIGQEEFRELFEAEKDLLFGTDDQYQRYLSRRGMSEEQYQRQRLADYRLQRLLSQRGLAQVSEQDVHSYYERYRESWRAEARVRARTVTVRLRREVSSEEEEEALRRISEIRQTIDSGELEFETAASELSDTRERYPAGDMGWIYRDNSALDELVSSMLFGLEPNILSQPVRTRLGYQLFLIVDRRPAGFKEFDEVRENLVVHVQHRAELAVRSAVLQELMDRYDIGYSEDRYGFETREEIWEH